MFPIKYKEPIFRPPSEGNSFLIQLTIGCSNNKCTYCDMYRSKKYSERSFGEVSEELIKSKDYFDKAGYTPKRIFLCDGDALGASMDLLIPTLELINKLYPNLDRVGIYATAENMLDKTEGELNKLSSLKLNMAYLGLESGHDKILHMIVKGNTREDMILGSQKLMKAGFKLSIIAMLGIGGEKFSANHIADTASIISEISPHYFSLLTTISIPGTPFNKMVERGLIKELSSVQLFTEMKGIIENIESDKKIIFRANHVSNQFPLGGILPRDKDEITRTLSSWIKETDINSYPPKPTVM